MGLSHGRARTGQASGYYTGQDVPLQILVVVDKTEIPGVSGWPPVSVLVRRWVCEAKIKSRAMSRSDLEGTMGRSRKKAGMRSCVLLKPLNHVAGLEKRGTERRARVCVS